MKWILFVLCKQHCRRVDGVIFFLNVKNCVYGFWQNVFVKLKGKKNIDIHLTLTLRKKLSNFISRKSLVVLRCRWYFLSFWFSIIMVFIFKRYLVLVITATNFCKNLDMTLEIISNNNNSVDLFCNGFLKIKMCRKKWLLLCFIFMSNV